MVENQSDRHRKDSQRNSINKIQIKSLERSQEFFVVVVVRIGFRSTEIRPSSGRNRWILGYSITDAADRLVSLQPPIKILKLVCHWLPIVIYILAISQQSPIWP
jgi:hypothetical protein